MDGGIERAEKVRTEKGRERCKISAFSHYQPKISVSRLLKEKVGHGKEKRKVAATERERTRMPGPEGRERECKGRGDGGEWALFIGSGHKLHAQSSIIAAK